MWCIAHHIIWIRSRPTTIAMVPTWIWQLLITPTMFRNIHALTQLILDTIPTNDPRLIQQDECQEVHSIFVYSWLLWCCLSCFLKIFSSLLVIEGCPFVDVAHSRISWNRVVYRCVSNGTGDANNNIIIILTLWFYLIPTFALRNKITNNIRTLIYLISQLLLLWLLLVVVDVKWCWCWCWSSLLS